MPLLRVIAAKMGHYKLWNACRFIENMSQNIGMYPATPPFHGFTSGQLTEDDAGTILEYLCAETLILQARVIGIARACGLKVCDGDAVPKPA
jgi:hypothetical protein